MEEILIRIKDHDKLESLMNFLLSVDYIEVKKLNNHPNTNLKIFSTVGLWKNREIDLESIRKRHGNMALCDTNILIEFWKGNPSVVTNLTKLSIENISISSVTQMELYYGALDKNELSKIKEH